MNVAHPGQEQLELFYDGELYGEVMVGVKQHVSSCSPCRAQLDSMTRLGELVRAATRGAAEEFEAERFWERLEARLEGPEAGVSALERFFEALSDWFARSGFRWVPALVASVVLLVGLPSMWKQGPSPSTAVAPVASNTCFVDSVEAGRDDVVMVNHATGEEGSTVIWLLAADLGAEDMP